MSQPSEYPTVVVTGDTGFIGRRTMAALRSLGLEAYGLRTNWPDLDLLVPGAVRTLLEVLQPSRIVHLAWAASSREDYRHDRQQGWWAERSLALITESLECGVAVTGVGSVAEVDVQDRSPYGRARAVLWKEVAAAATLNELAWARVHYAFDPEAGHPRLFQQLRDSRESESAAPVLLQTPQSTHDFVHVDDVGEALALSVAWEMSGLVEIGSGTAHSVEDVAKAMRGNYLVSSGISTSDGSSLVADITRLRALGWTPRRTLDFFE